MADVSQLFTYGIGTPGDIPHLVLLGLSPTGPIADIPFMCAHFGLSKGGTAVTNTKSATARLTIREC